jgi:hypothetical protein
MPSAANNLIMLSVIMLNAIMLSAIMLSAIMLSDVMLSVIMMNVAMLSWRHFKIDFFGYSSPGARAARFEPSNKGSRILILDQGSTNFNLSSICRHPTDYHLNIGKV